MATTVNDVYRMIKEISGESMVPRPPVNLNILSRRLRAGSTELMPALKELTDIRLITFNDTSKQSVRLTLLGNAVTRTKQ
ncbi:MAG TPA: hypothetical protein VL093_11785 [Flavipsychrobacter sp.]|jgi:predicted transcriptional regulator|nr:hypothetical protein [Flavipsychrobacter sp.]